MAYSTAAIHGRSAWHAGAARGVGLGVLLWLFASPVSAEQLHDFVLFTSIEGSELFNASDAALEETDTHLSADLLYVYSGPRIRVLAEYMVSNDENELERLQAGWLIDEQTTLWAGRFHAVSKLWTSEYHHGQFLQNSISRPRLEEWEDEFGPMPSHITGLLLEHRIRAGDDAEWTFAAAAGFGPKFVDDRLEAYDLLDPRSDHHGAANINIAYRPEVLSTSQFGFVASWSDIAVGSISVPGYDGLEAVHQFTAGLFADRQWRDWRMMAMITWFDNELRYADRKTDDDFVLGYLQAEYAASADWTLVGRAEFGPGQGDSPYLGMLPEFIAERYMFGARWDIHADHSISVEMARTGGDADSAGAVAFSELRLQWSAVFR